jgi:hypothetical protein
MIDESRGIRRSAMDLQESGRTANLIVIPRQPRYNFPLVIQLLFASTRKEVKADGYGSSPAIL